MRHAIRVCIVSCLASAALSACTPSDRDSGQLASAMDTSATEGERVPDRENTRVACTVADVSDGDSFRCTNNQRVRLLLLDAPEMDQAPYGTQARNALRARLPRGSTVWLEFDVQREDRYGRTLAYVYTDAVGGEQVNLAQARDGWAVAVVFPPNVRDIDVVRRAVATARNERLGLWRDGTFTCEPIAHKQGKC